MVDPIGFRFRPTDEEMVDHYLRLKNLGSDTSHVDGVISTVNICSFDPWDLPSKSMIKSRDAVWYFFCVKEKKHNRGDQQKRKTKSGYWKKTGNTSSIMRKGGTREKIGEKRFLVFKNRGGGGSSSSKSDWVMHEYHSTLLSPEVTYTICKLEFKGEEAEIPSSSAAIHENPSQFSGFLDMHQETQLEDAVRRAINSVSTDDFNSLFNDDEQSIIVSMQENCSDYRPPKPLTGVLDDLTSDDDNDSGSISATTTTTTNSVGTSSTCDSFASSNHRTDQINTEQSPDSSIKLVSLAQEVSQTLGQRTEIREYKLGQATVRKKRASFFYRMIRRFVKK